MVQFPPFARANRHLARHQRRITGPRPAANAGNNASGHSPPGRLASCTRQQRTRRARPTLRATPGRLPAQPPLSGPHPAAQRGFCTIRRIATACRRRVAPLMAQFPPFARANRHLARHQRRPTRPRPVACPPSHRSPAHPTGGFAPLDASLRRVAPLMLQFPPFARANRHLAHHQRRPIRPRPRTSQSPATTGGNFVHHQLFRQNEIKPTQLAQTVTN